MYKSSATADYAYRLATLGYDTLNADCARENRPIDREIAEIVRHEEDLRATDRTPAPRRRPLLLDRLRRGFHAPV